MTLIEKIQSVQNETEALKGCQKFVVRHFSYKGGNETLEFHNYDDMVLYIAGIREHSDSCVVEGVYSKTLWDCM